jgi:hypothetical protein
MHSHEHISDDDVRREAAAIQELHEATMPALTEAVARIFDGDSKLSLAQRADLVLGRGFARRRLLQVGGLSVVGAAILAACGSDNNDQGGGATTSGASTTSGAATTTSGATTTAGATTTGMGGATTTAPGGAGSDATILRTASSIEELAVAAYQTAIDSGLVKTPAVGDAAKLFQAQHKEHSALFQSATKAAGGQPFTEPNPAILQALKPTIDGLKDEAGVLKLAYDLENVAAETYQANVGTFKDMTLNAAIMSVGGVEARHAALLALVLGQAPVPKAFQTTRNAVKAGTGV